MKILWSRFAKRLILIILILSIATLFFAHKFVQKFGFDGIGEFISVYSHNKELAEKVTPDQLQITMGEEDYQFLKSRRDQALERGIQINDGEDNYVQCKIVQGLDTIKGEMRLKGHMTDHLEGDKWSFRVKTKKKPVFGMTRFSLQAPGTRNYAYEWVYHQLLKHEEIIHLNYDFIRLKLNEKDLGIYAIEEHFGQHVLEHNDRPSGAILRWNPNLYWEWRINELQGTYMDEQYSSYASSFVEPYEKGSVEDDSLLIDTYVQGAKMLEEFRRGEKTTSEIFDVEKMASFHAIIDLVGGHHSLDWSDVKFFFNSESGKIEPVGYESFSVRKTESICGQRIPDNYDLIQFNYHDRLFADPIFFEAYIKALERICTETYFYDFAQSIQNELDLKLGILAHEFPYRKFTFDLYYENIELIRKNMELPKPLHAFKQASTDSIITISLTPVSDYPIEILALTVDGKAEFKLDSSFILPAKARNTYAHYFEIKFHHDGKKLKNLKLKARIPGSSKVFDVEVSDLPYCNIDDTKFPVMQDLKDEKNDILVSLNDSTSFFNSKEVVIDKPYFFSDSSHTLKFFPGQHVHFIDDGAIISSGKIEAFGGSEDNEAILFSTDTTKNESQSTLPAGQRFYLNGGEASFVNVEFVKSNNFILASDAVLFFKNCSFSEIDQRFLIGSKGTFRFVGCASGSVNSFGSFDRSLVYMKDFCATKGELFLNGDGALFRLSNCTVKKYDVVVNLNHVSNFTASGSFFSANTAISTLNNSSDLKMYGGTIDGAAVGFKLDFETKLPGNSTYLFYRAEAVDIDKLESRKGE